MVKLGLALSFDDVSLVPQSSDLKSRDDVSLAVKSPVGVLHTPVFVAPMDTVCGPEMALVATLSGVTPVLHRGAPLDVRLNALRYTIQQNHLKNPIGFAFGLKEDVQVLLDCEVQPDFLCLDTANGHNEEVLRAVEGLARRVKMPIMCGNVATGEGAYRLIESGARMIRVGIGGGSACLTRIQTGHGLPTLASVVDVVTKLDTLHFPKDYFFLIADGGIRTSGDAVKALAAGAHGVMIGGYLAGSSATPGEVVKIKGKSYKDFRGMASAAAKGGPRYMEGASGLVSYKGSTDKLLSQFLDGLRSGLSYSGVDNFTELKTEAQFIQVTPNGAREGHAHAFSG